MRYGILVLCLVGCEFDPAASVAGDTGPSDVSDGGGSTPSGGHHHYAGGGSGNDGSGGDTDNDSSDGSESDTDSVCISFSEGYDKLTLMLESSGDSKWDTAPAATMSNSGSVCGTIAHGTCIKVQVMINDGANWYDWAAYNDQATRCAWQPYVTTLNGSAVGVQSFPWDMSDGSSPATSEGCDGWIGSCDL